MLALVLMLQDASAQPIKLTCDGGGTANKIDTATVYGTQSMYGSVGSTPVSPYGGGSRTISRERQQQFADQVDVQLFGGDDRIHMPRTMLPPFHGGADGWFRLKNVQTDARSIKDSVAVNFMNSPKVFIDRVTGIISISGKAGDFTVQCQAMNPNAPARF